jgi:hypothetical protein
MLSEAIDLGPTSDVAFFDPHSLVFEGFVGLIAVSTRCKRSGRARATNTCSNDGGYGSCEDIVDSPTYFLLATAPMGTGMLIAWGVIAQKRRLCLQQKTLLD